MRIPPCVRCYKPFNRELGQAQILVHLANPECNVLQFRCTYCNAITTDFLTPDEVVEGVGQFRTLFKVDAPEDLIVARRILDEREAELRKFEEEYRDELDFGDPDESDSSENPTENPTA